MRAWFAGMALAAVALSGCETPAGDPGGTGSGTGGGSTGPVVVDQGGDKISVALGEIGVNCPAGASSAADCAGTSLRAKVTRDGTPFAGTEDERAAARVALGPACEARGMAPGRFGLTDGNFQGGIWVFDDACL